MSGGFFNYLHQNGVEELWHERRELFKLVGCLYVEGYEDAAEEFKQFFEAIDNAFNPRSEKEPSKGLGDWWSDLRWVAKALEWWKSGDTPEYRFRKAWREYQNEGGETE